MRKIFVCLFLSVFVFLLKAQDQIITSKGDTIFCKIVTMNTSRIFYEQTDGTKITGKSIVLDNVVSYSRQTETIAKQTQLNRSEIVERRRTVPEKRIIFELSVGVSNMPWLLGSVGSSEMNEAYEQLKKGLGVGVSVHNLFTSSIGFGLQYSFFSSGYSGNSFQVIDPTYPIYMVGNIQSRQYINYVGPSVLFQQFLDPNHKLKLSETLSVGVLSYRNEEQFSMDIPSSSSYTTSSYNVLGNGLTIGGRLGCSVEYLVLPYLSVGVGGSFLYGQLSTMNLEYRDSGGNSESIPNQKLDNSLNLSRFDYGLVLKFHL